ncbi:hypothetical protein HaLaN_29540 [Haematococcus lacustris]|uniref:Uncharacterized protein n=1 Tax=Haematococcus lacustris TaxID=44745 RepID=A0A6A0AEF9_HAELA|nr:hypothetical protein HaLaN_29540 [Haematococcus lacustris]
MATAASHIQAYHSAVRDVCGDGVCVEGSAIPAQLAAMPRPASCRFIAQQSPAGRAGRAVAGLLQCSPSQQCWTTFPAV